MEETVKKHFPSGTILVAAVAAFVMTSTPQLAAQEVSASTAAQSLDFGFFKARVEPIFLKKRPGLARCYVCHGVRVKIGYRRSGFRLQTLSPESTFWTEEQSRLNYEVVSRLVTPGETTKSRLLMHPLSPDAGGEHHGGGRQFASQSDPDWLTLAQWVRGEKAGGSSDRIYVANHAGDNVHVIDPATNKVVQVIEGIEVPHGIGFSPDGSRVYITKESENLLVVVDQKTGEIIKTVPLNGTPNTLVVTKDGGRVFVGLHEPPGALDIVDTVSLKLIRSIPMGGPLHDIYLTADGKYVVAGSEEEKFLKVVDVQSEQPVWEVKFEREVRTMAIESGPDGSGRRIFVNLDRFHGFAVVDFKTHEEVARIKLPDDPTVAEFPGSPCHGIGVAPDGKSLWVNSKPEKAVFVYSLPDLKLVGHAPTGALTEWITFTRDGKKVYDSNGGDNTVSVIDAESLKEVIRIPVGQVPERVSTLNIP
jgi:YVTN family beta-propeller protein